MSTREALLEAGATRLRPILMTALANHRCPVATGYGSGRKCGYHLQRTRNYRNRRSDQLHAAHTGYRTDCV